jgi:hypothetical protein
MELTMSWIGLVGFAFAAALVILAGCTYNIVQLPDGKTFSIDRVPTTPIHISWVHAEEENGHFVIIGVLGVVLARSVPGTWPWPSSALEARYWVGPASTMRLKPFS